MKDPLSHARGSSPRGSGLKVRAALACVSSLWLTGCSMDLSITKGGSGSPIAPPQLVGESGPSLVPAETVTTNNGYRIRLSIGEPSVTSQTTAQGYTIESSMRE